MDQYSELLEKGEEPIKFAIVGVSGIFVNFLILFISKEFLGLPDPVSLALGIAFSVTTNYAFNRIWTFESNQPILPEYVKYVGSNFVGFSIQYIISYLIVERSGFDQWQFPIIKLNIPIIYIGSFIGIFFGFISNFLFSKFFVFEQKPEN